MANTKIRIAGVGGQGVVLSGITIGRTASVYENKYAVQTQSYGSSARGGDVCSEIIISDRKIIYPKVLSSDLLIALSQKALERYINKINSGGILIIDSDLIEISTVPDNIKLFKESFNKIAIDEFGNNTIANMIMLGYVTEKTGILPINSIKKAIKELVPSGTEELNLKAVKRGIELGE